MSGDTPRMYALRGATTVAEDSGEAIAAGTAELVEVLLARNALPVADIVSAIFTVTPDLRADFPAAAARRVGLSRTPLLCCQEIPVEGAVPRCIRVLLHAYMRPGAAVHHVYLHEARQLRLDLPE